MKGHYCLVHMKGNLMLFWWQQQGATFFHAQLPNKLETLAV